MSREGGPRILFGAGGSGGHIFPAMAVADRCRVLSPASTIQFVGAEGRLEEEVVPRGGYHLDLLPITGFDGRLTLANMILPFKVIRSYMKARAIIREFRPDVVVCAGGFVSWPVGKGAIAAKVPLVVMESNALPGKVNRILAPKAEVVHAAFEKVTDYLPGVDVRMSGNPIRSVFSEKIDRAEACRSFGLDPEAPTLLVTGGSQGSRSINNVFDGIADTLVAEGTQVIWQTGRSYQGGEAKGGGLYRSRFIHEMERAYGAADLVICRAGAMTISELKVVGKPSILVPLPTAAEDHQTVNARAMVESGAARTLRDRELGDQLCGMITELVARPDLLASMGSAARALARFDADDTIARDLLGRAGFEVEPAEDQPEN